MKPPTDYPLAADEIVASSPLLNTIHRSLSAAALPSSRPRLGACLRDALDTVIRLRRQGLRSEDSWLVLGSITDGAGQFQQHAWALSRIANKWESIDGTGAGAESEREIFLLLNGNEVRLADPTNRRIVADLNPQFFLSTHTAINDLALQGLIDDSEIDDINHVQSIVDNPFQDKNYDPREHFDNSMIDESIALLNDRLSWDNGDTPLHTITAGVPRAIAFGLAVHAAADFYAHSNYVPMAAAFLNTTDPASIPTFDELCASVEFLSFVKAQWLNVSIWHDVDGYSSTVVPTFTKGFERCLFTGAYSADMWVARSGIPHHDSFAVDQPDSPLVHEDPIQRRTHPFAFPDLWRDEYERCFAVAVRHVRKAVERAMAGSRSPFLGDQVSLPAILRPPQWILPNGLPARDVPPPVREADGSMANG